MSASSPRCHRCPPRPPSWPSSCASRVSSRWCPSGRGRYPRRCHRSRSLPSSSPCACDPLQTETGLGFIQCDLSHHQPNDQPRHLGTVSKVLGLKVELLLLEDTRVQNGKQVGKTSFKWWTSCAVASIVRLSKGGQIARLALFIMFLWPAWNAQNTKRHLNEMVTFLTNCCL